MKKGTLAGIALVCAAVGGLATFTAVQAMDNDTKPFVDKDFQVALRKHLQRKFFNFIDASDEQKTQIIKIGDDHEEERKVEREKVRVGLTDLSGMMAGDADKDALIAKEKELRNTIDEIVDRRFSTLLQVRELLSPTQRKLVSDKIVKLLNRCKG